MVFVAQNVVAVGSEDAFKIISLRQVETEICSLQGEKSESVKVLDSHCIWEKNPRSFLGAQEHLLEQRRYSR